MEEIYGNPPSALSLGMLLSDTPNMITGMRWLVDINYNNEGHVNDDDAKDINYDDLLKQLKEEAADIVKNNIPNLKVINIDDTYEELLKKAGLDKPQSEFTSDELSQSSKLMGQARKETTAKLKAAQESLENIINRSLTCKDHYNELLYLLKTSNSIILKTFNQLNKISFELTIRDSYYTISNLKYCFKDYNGYCCIIFDSKACSI